MPGVRTHVQSDGSVVDYRLIGDEFLNYMIDANGDLLEYGEDGDIYYAEWISESEFRESISSPVLSSVFEGARTRSIAGFVTPTNRKPAGSNAIAGLPSENEMRPLRIPVPKYILNNVGNVLEERNVHWREYHNSTRIFGSMQAMSDSTTTIGRNILVIYVRFEDESNLSELRNRELSNADINNIVFNENRQGSAAHYYRTVTGGAVRYTPARETHGTSNDGIIRVTVPGRHNNWRSNYSLFRENVVMPALARAAPFVDFRNFTNGSSLYGRDLSIVFIVHGYESADNGTPGVWGHAGWNWNLGTFNGITIRDYCTIGAFHGNSANPRPFTLGILVHELGHNSFRFLDLYDIGSNMTKGISGAWSVMGTSWGGMSGEHAGTTPTGLDAYHLSMLYPPIFTVRAADLAAGQHFSLSGSHQFVKLETIFPNQYFLLQPRANVGYDRGFFRYMGSWPTPHGGLLIYHIDESKSPTAENTIWRDHPFFNIMEAHGGTQHLQYNTQGNNGNYSDLFYLGINRFTAATDPNSNLYSGSTATNRTIASGVSVTEIKMNIIYQNTAGGSVTAEFILGTFSPPAVTTTTLPDGNAGSAYNHTLTATGTKPITWSITNGGLPPGLSLNTTSGAITGTPTTTGLFHLTFRAANAAGNVTRVISIRINPALVVPTITTTSLPAGTAGSNYFQTLTATGTTPISWSLAGGSLPAGLIFYESGHVSGTPTAAGSSNFTVRATNAAGNDTRALSIVINASTAAPTITTASLPVAVLGRNYSQRLAATSTTPITWSIASGNLPAGLNLNASTGAITGTPTAMGASDFTVRATNSAENATVNLRIVVSSLPDVATTSLSGGIVGQSYSQRLAATGTAPITWDISARTLPAGLSLNASTGVISGTPTTAGTFNFTVRATNAAGNSTRALSIVVTAIPVITASTLPGGIVGRSYNQRLAATGTAPIIWSISSGTLPAGLSLNASTGAITGTPTAANTFDFTVRAINAAGSATVNLRIVVSQIPAVTTASLPGGVVGQPYIHTLAATGSAPMTWSISSRTLPAGLTLNATTGVISGTPTTMGTFTFSVRATNAAGNATSSLSIVIK